MYSRITSNPNVLHGKPCVKGTRLSVEFILELLASGATRAEIAKAYPGLSEEDVAEAIRYAAQFVKNEILISAEVTP
ncbi:MAG: DUF433 domain-containing protein [Pirellulales bacterium]